MVEQIERRLFETEKHLAQLGSTLRTLENAVEGRDGVLALIGRMDEEIKEIHEVLYGGGKRKEKGLIELAKVQEGIEEDRRNTARKVQWLINGLGITLGSLITYLYTAWQRLP